LSAANHLHDFDFVILVRAGGNARTPEEHGRLPVACIGLSGKCDLPIGVYDQIQNSSDKRRRMSASSRTSTGQSLACGRAPRRHS